MSELRHSLGEKYLPAQSATLRRVTSVFTATFNNDTLPDVVGCGVRHVGALLSCATNCSSRFEFEYESVDQNVSSMSQCIPIYTSEALGVPRESTGRQQLEGIIALDQTSTNVYFNRGSIANPQCERAVIQVSLVSAALGELTTQPPSTSEDLRELVYVERDERSRFTVTEFHHHSMCDNQTRRNMTFRSDYLELSELTLGDVDQDGYLDVVAIALSAQAIAVVWFRNMGESLNTLQFSEAKSISEKDGGTRFELVDLTQGMPCYL